MIEPVKGGILKTAAGRFRLGWRILAYLVLAFVVMLPLAGLLPSTILSGAVTFLAGGLVAGWALLALDGRSPAALGFPLSRAAVTESAAGTALGVGVALAVVVAMAGFGGIRWTAQAGSPGAWLTGAAGALAFLAIPAAAEEAVLRGYPLQALGEAWGPVAALLVTSVAFGLLHLPNPGVSALAIANITAAGLFLGVVYLKTASLWWASGAHLGWNWAHGYLVDVPVSGLELMDAPYYDGVATGASWLGGGSFGPEGSAVATVVILTATLVCWRASWLRIGPAAAAAEPLILLVRGTRSSGDNEGEVG